MTLTLPLTLLDPNPTPNPHQVWRQVRKGTAQSRQRAKEMMKEWFSQPQRDNDEGYALTT